MGERRFSDDGEGMGEEETNWTFFDGLAMGVRKQDLVGERVRVGRGVWDIFVARWRDLVQLRMRFSGLAFSFSWSCEDEVGRAG